MKLIAVLFIILTGSVGLVLNIKETPNESPKEHLHRSCQCAGALCSCSVSCLDEDEIPSCTCGALTCICVCNPKDHYTDGGSEGIALPTMDFTQRQNSEKLEGYLRSRGSAGEVTLADGVKALREAILNGNAAKYLDAAKAVNATFENLPTNEKGTLETWMDKNFK